MKRIWKKRKMTITKTMPKRTRKMVKKARKKVERMTTT
jgi:hypothetical protein